MKELLTFKVQMAISNANNDLYLCTLHAEDVKVGKTSTTAASILNWAVKLAGSI